MHLEREVGELRRSFVGSSVFKKALIEVLGGV